MYINVAGGVRLTESAIDAALAAALYSARADLPLPRSSSGRADDPQSAAPYRIYDPPSRGENGKSYQPGGEQDSAAAL